MFLNMRMYRFALFTVHGFATIATESVERLDDSGKSCCEIKFYSSQEHLRMFLLVQSNYVVPTNNARRRMELAMNSIKKIGEVAGLAGWESDSIFAGSLSVMDKSSFSRANAQDRFQRLVRM